MGSLFVPKIDRAELYRRAATVIAAARAKMNGNGGEHWITGSLYQDSTDEAERELGIQRYCAVGGLNAASEIPQLGVADYRNYGGKEYAETREAYNPDTQKYEQTDLTSLVENFIVLDAAKVIINEVRMGNSLSNAFGEGGIDVADLSFEEVQDAERGIIEFNDSGSGFIEEKWGSVELSHEARFARISSLFIEAERQALIMASREQ